MSVPDFLSKKVRKKPQSGLTSSRYSYFSLDEAEPDLGDPVVGPSSVGAKPFPQNQDAFILASFGGTDRGPSRYWVPPSSLTGLGLGLVPGALTVRDEGNLVGSANSFTIFDFVGAGVTVDYVGAASSQQTGIATIRINSAAEGDVGQFQYKESDGFLEAVPGYFYYSETGNVGFGTTSATEKFHVSGITTQGKIKANAFIGNPEAIVGGITLRPGDDENTFSKIGKLRAGYINANTISIPDSTGFNTSLIDTLISTRFTSDYVNVSGIATISTIQSTVFEILNQNVTGVSTIYRHVGTYSSIGIATITTLKSTDQVFSGITSIFESDITSASIGYATITNSNIGVSTIQSLTAVYSDIGLSTVTNQIVTNEIVGFSSIGISTIGFLSSTNSYIGIATVENIEIKNAVFSESGNISIGNTLNISGIAATDIIVSNRLGIKTDPAYELDINGDFRFNGLIYANNGRGVTGEVLTSQGENPAIWSPAQNVTVGAANSVSIIDTGIDRLYNITFTDAVDDTGYIRVDNGNLVYNPSLNYLGVGNTIPQFTLDVNGNINFTGTLYENGEIYVASNWGKDVNGNIWKDDGNVGIGTSISTAQLTVKGKSDFVGDIIVDPSHKIGIGSTNPRSGLDVSGDTRLSGYTHFEGAVTENVTNSFSSEFIPSAGTLTIDASDSTVAVGFLTTTVSEWAFTGINTESSKATTITLIIDSSSLITYGEQCSINGVSVSGGVRWPGGIAPNPTNNEDILSFALVKDSSGTFRVYGTSSLNFS